MRSSSKARNLYVVLMLLVALVANLARPTQLLAETKHRAALAAEIPDKLAEWNKASGDDLMIVDPGQQSVIKYLYSDQFNASYVNDQQRVVMMSLAYGRDQSDGHDIHKPDLCYPAQGFNLLEQSEIPVRLDAHRSIVVRYMKMQRGQRVEPLLYWTTAGDFLYRTKLQRRMIAFRYSLDNQMPDGMIVRVSMLEGDGAVAKATLIGFIQSWYATMPASQRARYFGAPDA